jgi:excinuclease ABC subunit B
LIRPTGLLDPLIEIRPTQHQIDDLLEEVRIVSERDERVLVTTLTKRMAEELAKFLANAGVRCRYIHSDIDTMERVEILRDLRLGLFDVLVGINLLREGLDLPEVSLVAILDADKEGFLRSERSLVQVVGRAARNVNGKVIMYADKITDSMQKTMDETTRRRKKQIEYNFKHNITPQSIIKDKTKASPLGGSATGSALKYAYVENETLDYAADPVTQYMTQDQIEKAMLKLRKEISRAAKEMDFNEAARLRDELFAMEKKLKK